MMLDKLKTLLYLETDEHDKVLAIMIDDGQTAIKNYCHIKSVPPALEPIARQLVISAFKEITGDLPVESVKRGDTQITYGGTIDTSVFTDKQKSALNGYRRFKAR